MEAFLHQIFAGLANGGIYASVALALVMIYQSTHHINFAQGEMAMFSTFIAWALMQAGWPYWVAFFATIAISFAGGLLIQRTILKPVEKAPVLTNVIVFIGWRAGSSSTRSSRFRRRSRRDRSSSRGTSAPTSSARSR
jgi:branched-chain amino acid transport system permease protein